MSRFKIVLFALILSIIGLSIALLLVGSVDIPVSGVFNVICGKSSNRAWEFIVLESRLPLIVTSCLSGAALAVCGLLLQTSFNNPLADPSILGISTGAGLGVALLLLLSGGALYTSFGGYIAILFGALIGAFLIMMILLLFSTIVKSANMLLIVGVLISYLASSAISLLNFFSTQEGVHSFVIWGLGNFSGVTTKQLPFFSIVILVGIIGAMALIKPLNALLLGERYAENLGVNLKRTRNMLLLITGLLTAIVTAFCGPIGFIGLVVPHLARLMLGTSDHLRLMPITILSGGTIAMICSFLSVLPYSGIIPINAITPIIGVPVIIFIVINRRKIFYFN